MKTRNILVCFVLLIASMAAPSFAAAPATQPLERRGEDLLSRRIPDIEEKDAPVKEVLEFLCEQAQVNLVMATDASIYGNMSLKMKNVELHTALEAVTETRGMGFELQGNNLVVFSLTSPPPSMILLEIYGVSDLVDYTAEHEMSSLIETIKATVAPDSWRDTGGNAGTIRDVNGSLVIKQLARNHREISLLLGKLREHKSDIAPSTHAQAAQMEAKVQIVGNLKETCSDPKAMTIIAISELRALEKPEDLIKFIGACMAGTNYISPPTRNAMRLTLKDLYLEKGDIAKAKEQLEAMLMENNSDLSTPRTRGN